MDPRDIILSHYSHRYQYQKHDSPEQSRISLNRRIWNLLRNRKSLPTARILDIGSGPQSLEKQLFMGRDKGQADALKGYTFHTLDLAEISRRKLLAQDKRNVSHVRADAVRLPYRDGIFGLVVSNHAIDFAPRFALREAYRVLARGGTAIFCFHHPSMLPDDLSTVRNDTVRKYWTHLRENKVLYESEGQIRRTLEEMGYSNVEVSLGSDSMDQWWEVVANK